MPYSQELTIFARVSHLNKSFAVRMGHESTVGLLKTQIMDIGVKLGLVEGQTVTKLVHEGRILSNDDAKIESVGIRNYS